MNRIGLMSHEMRNSRGLIDRLIAGITLNRHEENSVNQKQNAWDKADEIKQEVGCRDKVMHIKKCFATRKI